MSSVFRWLVTPLFAVLVFLGIGLTQSANASQNHVLLARADVDASRRSIAAADDLSITASSVGKIYSESAERGDGTTHLARKAIHEFVRDRGMDGTTSRAQRVYAEDALKNIYGNAWLNVGETRTFSAEELATALDNARAIDPTTLDRNLAPYVAKVDWSYYEELKWQNVESGSAATNDATTSDPTSQTPSDESSTSDTATNSSSDLNPGWILVILLAVILILGMYFYLQARNDEFSLPEMNDQPGTRPLPAANTTKQSPQNPVVKAKVVEPTAKPAGTPATPVTNAPQGKPVTPAPSVNKTFQTATPQNGPRPQNSHNQNTQQNQNKGSQTK